MPDLTGQNWRVMHGDCRAAFLSLPAASVHCIVTSPPYWGGVRDYGIPGVTWADGWEGCYGNEPRVEQYVEHTLEIFAALGHALRDDGVIWWNIGDCYADVTKWGGRTGGKHVKDLHGEPIGRSKRDSGARPGNKSLVPYRVALALQDAGWIIRQDVIWRKPSPMPESIDGCRWERCRVKVAAGACPRMGERTGSGFDYRETELAKWAPCPGCDKCRDSDGYILRRGSWRPTTAHEFVFQIVKSADYFCDAQAAQEIAVGGSPGNHEHKSRIAYSNGDGTQRRQSGVGFIDGRESRNPRSVWPISSEAYKGKHFAAFPTMLAHKCIQASTSAGGCCAACGAQYAPVVEKGRVPTRPGEASKFNEWKQDQATAADGQRSTASPNRDPQRHVAVKRTLGYRPTCSCNAGEPVPPTVADPFTGSGTTLQVAINTGRQFVGSEIADHYLPLIQQRSETPWQPKDQRKAKPSPKRRKRSKREQLLFG